MSYKITDGISEADLPAWLDEAAKKYGVFDDGRVNYEHADIAAAVMCTIKCGEQILLVRRSKDVDDAAEYWSTVNGFLDDKKTVTEIAQNEIKEELNVDVELSQILVRKSYTLENPKEKRKYIVFPCLVELNEKPNIVLNPENTEYAWVSPAEVNNFDILEDLPHVINAALGLN